MRKEIKKAVASELGKKFEVGKVYHGAFFTDRIYEIVRRNEPYVYVREVGGDSYSNPMWIKTDYVTGNEYIDGFPTALVCAENPA